MGARVTRLSVCFPLRTRSQGPVMEPRVGLPAQRGMCFSLYLCLPLPAPALPVSNKYNLKEKEVG